jgi:hypothetical protein
MNDIFGKPPVFVFLGYQADIDSSKSLKKRCCNNFFPISIKFDNQVGHNVPQVMIGKSKVFFLKSEKAYGK